MKKKLLALILAAALCLGLAAPALALEYGEEYRGYTTAASQQYRDVTDTHWAKTSIETCSQRSWFNGYPDGTFRPEGLITREEAAKVFAVAMGLEIETDPEITYTDTKDNWAKAYIEATKPLFPNVANLQGTSSFRPKQTITREETIYALVIAWGYGSKAKNADLSVLNMFSDTSSISAGVKPHMAVGVSEGLVSGLPDGTIAAQKGLTRAEFATLLARALSHGYGDTKQEFQAPAITLDKYPAATTETQISVTGTVTPTDATLKLDGKSVKTGKDGSFTLTLELEVGKNTFTLTAENAYGTKDSKSITVERTEEAVTIRILSDVPETTQAATLAVNGKVENWSDACTLLLDNTRVSVDKDGYFQLTLQLEEGRNVFALTVARGQKEVGAATIQVTRATPEPSAEPSAKPSEKPSADPAEGSSSQGDKAPEKKPEPISTPTPEPERTGPRIEQVTGINFTEDVYFVAKGGGRTLEVELQPCNMDVPIWWKSWNPDIVDVNGTGLLDESTTFPVSAGRFYTPDALKPGCASIEAECNGYSDKCLVVVTTSEPELWPYYDVTMSVGDSQWFHVVPEYTGTYDGLYFTSSNPSVAAIDDRGFDIGVQTNKAYGSVKVRSGFVNAVGTGTSVISVHCDGMTDSFLVTVK